MRPEGIQWEVPQFIKKNFKARQSTYAVLIPVLNEGPRIRKQLIAMASLAMLYDLIIVDGGSSDRSLEPALLQSCQVRTLLTKTEPGGLGSQLRIGLAYAIEEGYEGIVLIDGNNKDNVEAISNFVQALKAGFDHVQGSRFIKGGKAIHTPLHRLLAIKLIHAPLLSIASRFRYTDTTNGFRAYSRRFLLDQKVQPFRNLFRGYEIHYYLAIRAARLGFRVKEIPVIRRYPPHGPIPTKIRSLNGHLYLMKALIQSSLGLYNP